MTLHRIRAGLALSFGLLVNATVTTAGDELAFPPDRPGTYHVGATVFSAPMYGGRVTRIQVFYPTRAPRDLASTYSVTTTVGTYVRRTVLGAVHDAPPARGPFPLIVHDHGGGSAGADHHRIGQLPVHEALASHGFVVVAPLHAADPVVRVRDLSKVIDVMLAKNTASGDLFFGRIDSARIGVSGMSAGGGAALGVAGGLAAADIPADARVKAMVVYEPAPPLVSDARNIKVPYLVMGGLRHAAGVAIPEWYAATTSAPDRTYVQIPDAAHFGFVTGILGELEQVREQALAANPSIPEPLTTPASTNAAAARAYELWNWVDFIPPATAPSFGSGRNLADRVGVNSMRSLDRDGDGFTDSPPFRRIDPPFLPKAAIQWDAMIPLIQRYTVAFWKSRLAGDARYERMMGGHDVYAEACVDGSALGKRKLAGRRRR
jgi:predicted dienelactone hydrolase